MRLRPPLTRISGADLQDMIAGGKVFERRGGIPTAVLDASGRRMIKVWHRERGFSSDRVRPYGYRFYFNCEGLHKRGIAAPRVERYCIVVPSGLHVAVYDYLPGDSLEQLAASNEPFPVDTLAAFYAQLHEKGVYFRSIHPGNILCLEDGRFGLIDVTDIRFYARPLSISLRVQNLLYAWTRRRHRHLFPAERVEALLEAYRCSAKLDPRAEARFIKLMRRALKEAGTVSA